MGAQFGDRGQQRVPTCGRFALLCPWLAVHAQQMSARELHIKADFALRDYFGWANPEPGPAASEDFSPRPIPRYRNLTKDEFNELVGKGIPFILEDAADGWEISSWRCSTFSKEFPNFKFRQEYSVFQSRGDESNRETFEGQAKPWWTQRRPNNFKDLPDDAPKYAPFYWDFLKAWDNEPERGWVVSEKGGKGIAEARKLHQQQVRSAVQRVESLVPFPRCMPEEVVEYAKRSTEFWLQPAETGSAAHIDGHCSSTIAFTLGAKGVQKRWRLQMVPPEPLTLPDAYKDGRVYATKEWFPQWEGITHHGEAIIFYTGFIHEGLNVSPRSSGTLEGHSDDSPEALDERCIIGLTYQFNAPMASGLYRHFYQRLRRLEEIRQCREDARGWAALGGKWPKVRDSDEAAVRRLSAERAAVADADGDGAISAMELEAFWSRSKRKGEHQSTSMVFEDLLRFHDADGDKRLAVAEVVETMGAIYAIEKEAWWAERREKSKARQKKEL